MASHLHGGAATQHATELLNTSSAHVHCWAQPDNGAVCYAPGSNLCAFVYGEGALHHEVKKAPQHLDWFLVGGFIVVTLGVVLSASSVAFLFYFRAKPVIRLSQYLFLQMFSVMHLMLNLSMAIHLVGMSTYVYGICSVYLYMLFVSVFGMYTILALKTWRAEMLRRNTLKLRRFSVPDSHMWAVFAGVEGVVHLIIIIWFVVDPPDSNPCTSLSCSARDNPYALVLLALSFLVVFATFVIAILARKVPTVAGEAYGIFIASAMVLFGFLVVTPVILREEVTDTAKFFSFCLYVLGVSLVGLIMLVFNKMRYFHMDIEEVQAAFLEKTARTREPGRTHGSASTADEQFAGRPSTAADPELPEAGEDDGSESNETDRLIKS